ncbi:hypothetical protein HK103_000146 [Boothiomyces macroporosus]|uniref:Uncharacterized protein n=1 Tax=Boothiomyces macroporosus TaxID=261099 RepID=A0AAD5YBH8_9FUNG|nr:hypothetical protein HK103_000146 [Boothiomyces macroporosus]
MSLFESLQFVTRKNNLKNLGKRTILYDRAQKSNNLKFKKENGEIKSNIEFSSKRNDKKIFDIQREKYIKKSKKITEVSQYDKNVSIVLGQSNGHSNYFRAFVNTVSIPSNSKSRLDALLPHRTKKSIRIYGDKPLVLLKPIKPKFIPGKPLAKRRVNGPEIAPNMAEINEFDHFENAPYSKTESNSNLFNSEHQHSMFDPTPPKLLIRNNINSQNQRNNEANMSRLSPNLDSEINILQIGISNNDETDSEGTDEFEDEYPNDFEEIENTTVQKNLAKDYSERNQKNIMEFNNMNKLNGQSRYSPVLEILPQRENPYMTDEISGNKKDNDIMTKPTTSSFLITPEFLSSVELVEYTRLNGVVSSTFDQEYQPTSGLIDFIVSLYPEVGKSTIALIKIVRDSVNQDL